jgi:YYY domain-containing protein
LIDAFIWWLSVELLGLIALPVTFTLFKSLPDRGYAFGKALSILIVSFLLWLAASAHVLPNAQWAIILIIALLAAGSLFLFVRRRHQIVSFLSENRRLIIATELIFLLSFVLMAVMRAYNPEILYTEKFKDFAYLNAVLRSDYFPPHDPWLSGASLSYYYFGYLMMAMLTNLTGIAASVSYNLSLALIFALTTIGAFSIGYNLVSLSRGGIRAAIGFGLVTIGLLALLGHFLGVFELLHAHGFGSEGFWDWVGVRDLDHPYSSAHWYPTDWWWWYRSAWVIGTVVDGNVLDLTINEFPFYSFLLGDLHPHLMALPFVLLNVSFCLEFFNSSASLGLAWLRRNWAKLLVFAICLGALGFINTWDFPTYAFLFLAAIFIGFYLRRGKLGFRFLRNVGIFCFALIGCALLLYALFHTELISGVTGGYIRGIGLVGDIDTRPFHFFIFWGLFLFLAVSIVLAQAWGTLKKMIPSRWEILAAILIPLLPLAIWAIAELVTDAGFSISGKFLHLLPLLLILSLILLILIKKSQRIGKFDDEGGKASIFALLLLFVGFLLIMGCELFYVDTGVWQYYARSTTVYKLYYQAWVLIAIASAFGMYLLVSRWRPATVVRKSVRASWWVVCVLLVVGCCIYPVAATLYKTNAFGGAPTLDGIAFVEGANPSEYEAIKWLNSEVEGAPVIVEAWGGGGHYYGYLRVSAYTGLTGLLPTWRHDVETIYRSEDIDEVQELLEKHNVTYVYVGHLERAQYGDEVGERLATFIFMDVIFENEGVTIYQVKEE